MNKVTKILKRCQLKKNVIIVTFEVLVLLWIKWYFNMMYYVL